MKIVYLDAKTITDCGLTLDEFKSYGDFYEYGIVRDEEITKLISDADAVFCNKSKLTADKLRQAKKLKFIGVTAAGYDNIDISYCHANGITVCNAGTYSTDNVTQQVFAFILNRYARVAEYDKFVKDGGWKSAPSFSPLAYRTNVISEKTLGIVGFGNIGMAVAKIAEAFGMKTLVYTRTVKENTSVRFVGFEELLKNSDIITVHCPLTEKTASLFDKEAFKKMKNSAYFINTSRGPVVNENDLYEALENGEISGAALDVLSSEPMAEDCKLINAKNITITPHIAWASDEAKKRLKNIMLSNFKAYLSGKPENEV